MSTSTYTIKQKLIQTVCINVPVEQEQTFSYQVYDKKYLQASNISLTLVGNPIADHSDVVDASPVGAAPTTF